MGAYRAYREAVDLARASGTKQELADAIYDFSFSPVASDTSASWTETLGQELREGHRRGHRALPGD